MKIIEISEKEDGSAVVDIQLTNEEVELLLQDAITRALENYVEMLKPHEEDNE